MCRLPSTAVNEELNVPNVPFWWKLRIFAATYVAIQTDDMIPLPAFPAIRHVRTYVHAGQLCLSLMPQNVSCHAPVRSYHFQNAWSNLKPSSHLRTSFTF